MTNHTTKSTSTPNVKIRFRVLTYGDGLYYLADHRGCLWVAGHSFGFAVSAHEYPSCYFDSEDKAWEHLPSEDEVIILAPDTPLWRVKLYLVNREREWDSIKYYLEYEPELTEGLNVLNHLAGKVLLPDLNIYERIEVTQL